MRLGSSVSRVGEISGAFGWREFIEQLADAFPSGFGRALCGFAQEVFELGEDLFDRVQVWRVWRQEEKFGAGAADCGADDWPLVAGEIVHDHNVPRRERGHEKLLNIFEEAFSVDRLIENAGCIDPVAAQGSEECHCFPMTIRHLGMEPLPFGGPATQRCHVGLGPGFIDENEPVGVNPALILLPLLAPPGDLGSQLFGWKHAFF